MATQEHFRVSSHLKDIIGRDLVTNEFVAVFELIKNSFDAGATRVDLAFDNDQRTIWIVDDGKGMDAGDIRDRWLFVAYSAKADGSEDAKTHIDYRDRIRPGGQFAGSKGIGRFSCDTLGKNLTLYSRTSSDQPTQKLLVEWDQFEADSRELFQKIGVSLGQLNEFPDDAPVPMPTGAGTVLRIGDVRGTWTALEIGRLRQYLEKLIDPFGTTEDTPVFITVVDEEIPSDALAELQGPVGNDLRDLLTEKTTRITVGIVDGKIHTELIDRGRTIYRISEPNTYSGLAGASVTAELFYLNRSAKATFTRRMGVQPVKFGSVFLFLNGFRVFPLGEETDDTLGLNRRKQQGSSRYLGTRDLMGRVDVRAPTRMFREASSRDAGLIEDARSRALYEAIRRHMIFRLERYVVGVNWKDKRDQDRDTAEGLETDQARERVLEVVGSLAKSKDVEIIYYDDEIVRVSDDADQVTDEALRAISAVAESRGDTSLLNQIEETRKRIQELQAEREEAQRAARQAMEERVRADARIAALEKQAAFLGSSKDVDVERVQLLMHQATIHLGHIRSAVANAAYETRNVLTQAVAPDDFESAEDFEDVLASVRQSARRISASIAGASLSSDRLRTVLSFAPNIRVDLETDKVQGDLVQFLREYFEVRLSGVPDMPVASFGAKDISLKREFSPVDIAVIVDNLMDNARKAEAKEVRFDVSAKGTKSIVIAVRDDGLGINDRKADPSKIFERGYTGSASGTGLGLYSVRQLLAEMGGTIDLVGDGKRADFDIVISGDLN